MKKFTFAIVALLLLSAVAEAGHRGLFGRLRDRRSHHGHHGVMHRGGCSSCR